jgi:hypothetical protein
LKSAYQPRKGLRAACLSDPRKVWHTALAYCQSHTRKGETSARKWAYGIWRGIYPGSSLPFGLYDSPCDQSSVREDAWGLVEREVTRFRKNSQRSAA